MHYTHADFQGEEDHDLELVRNSIRYSQSSASRKQIKCRMCGKKCSSYCKTCSEDHLVAEKARLIGVCGHGSGRGTHLVGFHLQQLWSFAAHTLTPVPLTQTA